MNDGTQDQLEVSFPASPKFTRIGRVTVSGLTMRLGINITSIDVIKKATEVAVQALQGEGTITVKAEWKPNELVINLSNPAATVSDIEKQSVKQFESSLIKTITVESSKIVLLINNPPESQTA